MGADPLWQRLAGRLSLLTGHYADAVSQFRRAQLLGSRDADEDLSIAYALRAEAEGRPSDYGLALEYSARALQQNVRNSTVFFNAALLAEKTFLERLAETDWRIAVSAELRLPLAR